MSLSRPPILPLRSNQPVAIDRMLSLDVAIAAVTWFIFLLITVVMNAATFVVPSDEGMTKHAVRLLGVLGLITLNLIMWKRAREEIVELCVRIKNIEYKQDCLSILARLRGNLSNLGNTSLWIVVFLLIAIPSIIMVFALP